MNIGILGGSFNPIHIGHCILASYISQFVPSIDEVWLCVSPQNPLKGSADPTYDNHRLEMAKLAIASCRNLKVCDIEFSLPRPSYSIDTLNRLKADYPDHQFRMIVGSDNWVNFHKWKDYQTILKDFGLLVYPRPGYPIVPDENPGNVEFIDAPQFEISSTFIRKAIQSGSDVRFLLPDSVRHYITQNQLYLNDYGYNQQK